MRLAFAFALALALTACGGPTTCVTTPCENNPAKTYQACGMPGSTIVEDDFGGKSCSCDTAYSLSPDCMSCQQMLKAFCAM